MKTTIRYERLFNLGHFENEKIGLETEMDENEDGDDSDIEAMFKQLREKVHAFHEKGEEWDFEKHEQSRQAVEIESKQDRIKQLEEELSKLKSQMEAGAVFIETKVE